MINKNLAFSLLVGIISILITNLAFVSNIVPKIRQNTFVKQDVNVENSIFIPLASLSLTYPSKPLTLSTTFSNTTFLFDDIRPVDVRFGMARQNNVPDISKQEYQRIEKEVAQNIERLGLNKSNHTLDSLQAITLSWPLRWEGQSKDYSYYTTNNYVDQEPSSQFLDYNCDDRSYDGHTGTDFDNWPFPWQKMEHGAVAVIAAASGTIVYKEDGFFDRECEPFTNKPANKIAIQHNDGSITWYLHMKKGSLTPKIVGATVDQGDYLGLVASSGSSSHPHLHFEVRDPMGNLIDPYAGTCNTLNSDSWWDTQKPYYESTIIKLTTGDDFYQFPVCPSTTDITYIKNSFEAGSSIYFTAFYRDQLPNQASQFTIYQPDNSIWQSWVYTATEYFTNSWWAWNYNLPADAPLGAWKFEVIDNGQIFEHKFFIISTQSNPSLILSDYNLDFGSLIIGNTSTPQTIIVQNTGNVTLTLEGIYVSADYNQVNDCFNNENNLAIGASCTITASFTPIGIGTRVSTLTLVSDSSTNPDIVTLSGIGIENPTSTPLPTNTPTMTIVPTTTPPPPTPTGTPTTTTTSTPSSTSTETPATITTPTMTITPTTDTLIIEDVQVYLPLIIKY